MGQEFVFQSMKHAKLKNKQTNDVTLKSQYTNDYLMQFIYCFSNRNLFLDINNKAGKIKGNIKKNIKL